MPGSTISGSVTIGVNLGVNYATPLTITATGTVIAPGTANAVGLFAAQDYLLNQGTVVGSYYASYPGNAISIGAGTVKNEGLIEGEAAGGPGVDNGISQTGGTVLNAGVINAGYGGFGIELNGGGFVANTGLITGGGGPARAGIYLHGGGTISNAGTIVGGGGSIGTAGAAGVSLTGAGSILNTGLIIGGGAEAQGVAGGAAVVIGAGRLVNRGTLSGGLSGGAGVRQTGGSGSNYGLIAGGAGSLRDVASGAGGAALILSGGRFTNLGSLAGGDGLAFADGVTGAGGAGADVAGNAILLNDAYIVGGQGEAGFAAQAGAGVYISGGTVVNAGDIAGGRPVGGSFGGAAGDAVSFGPRHGVLSIAAGGVLGGSLAGSGDIAGFAGRDSIVLDGVTETGFTYVNGIGLEVFAGGSATTLDIIGSFTTADFSLGNDTGNATIALQHSAGSTINGAVTYNVDVGGGYASPLTINSYVEGQVSIPTGGYVVNYGAIFSRKPHYGYGYARYGYNPYAVTPVVMSGAGTIENFGGIAAPFFYDGVVLQAGGTVVNAANIDGGYDAFGVDLKAGGLVTNSGKIYGGAGLFRPARTAVYLADGGTVFNSGTLFGGSGQGSAAGIELAKGGTIINRGVIVGGSRDNTYTYEKPATTQVHAGPAPDGYPPPITYETSGYGGAGVKQAGGVATNFGLVVGGAGYGALNKLADGGAGLQLSAGGTFINAGILAGGPGASADGSSYFLGVGGAGAVVASGGVLINDLDIVGGHGLYSYLYSSPGGVGVYIDGGTVINAGDIAGGPPTKIPPPGYSLPAAAVMFGTAAGVLSLAAGGVLGGTLAGSDAIASFAGRDSIVLDGVTETGFTYITGVGLEVFEGSAATTLDITGSFSTADFLVSNDAGNTTIALQPPPGSTISGLVTIGVTLGGNYTSPLTITATGDVESQYGVYGLYGVPAEVINYGTVGAEKFENDGIDLQGGGLLINAGLVVSLARDDPAVLLGAAGTVMNTGSISGGSYGYGVELEAGGLVTNAGKISGGGGLLPKPGIVLQAGGTINNTGTIIGGIGVDGDAGVLAGDGGTVTNSGIIIGGGGVDVAKGGPGVAITDGRLINFGTLTSYGASGVSGGAGLAQSGGTSTNFGLVAGGDGEGGFFGAGTGGAGLVLQAGGVFTNDGTLQGGAGAAYAQYNTGGDGGDGATIGQGAVLVNFGLITGGKGGDNRPMYASNGGAGVYIDGGTVVDAGIITGGAAAIPGGISGGDAVLFGTATGALAIASGSTVGGAVAGFAGADSIVLDGLTETGFTYVSGLGLEVFAGPSAVTLDITGSFSTADFAVTNDAGNATITLDGTIAPNPCFTAGTRILTPQGEVAVELMAPGDLVVTRAGEDRAVVWIGTRVLDINRHPRPDAVRPVIIEPDALADGVPARRLRLSPDHAFFLDGVLVPAKELLNGITIRVDMAATTVRYFHVELATHDILLAEGAAVESYLDTGHRGVFANAAAPLLLHPELMQLRREAEGCAPLCLGGARLAAIRARLAARLTARPPDWRGGTGRSRAV